MKKKYPAVFLSYKTDSYTAKASKHPNPIYLDF